MTIFFATHSRFEDADPNTVILTLFKDRKGFVRGWYIGPLSFDVAVPLDWHTSPTDDLSGNVAFHHARDIAARLKLRLSIVDPENLWRTLRHE